MEDYAIGEVEDAECVRRRWGHFGWDLGCCVVVEERLE